MSNRLDQEREAELQPKRMEFAISELKKAGIVTMIYDETTIKFLFNGHQVKFFPYSGWHTGKSIKDGRGLNSLLQQLKTNK